MRFWVFVVVEVGRQIGKTIQPKLHLMMDISSKHKTAPMCYVYYSHMPTQMPVIIIIIRIIMVKRSVNLVKDRIWGSRNYVN